MKSSTGTGRTQPPGVGISPLLPPLWGSPVLCSSSLNLWLLVPGAAASHLIVFEMGSSPQPGKFFYASHCFKPAEASALKSVPCVPL